MKMVAVLLAALIGGTLSVAAAEAKMSGATMSADAPELAAAGQNDVGYKTLTLIHAAQPDVEAGSLQNGLVPLRDRKLIVDIWYPARAPKAAKPMVYQGQLWGEPPRAPVAFKHSGVAVAGAKPVGTGHPLVIFSHGYSNAPAMMTWLTENLASKGYVVAGIRHQDPNPYLVTEAIRAAPNFNRPRDIAFVAKQLRVALQSQIDPARVALIGYSQGGYGVLTAGGASLDPEHPAIGQVSGGHMKTIARGAPGAADIMVPNVKAIIALAPAGGGDRSAWGREGLAELKAPLLLIAGENDPVVGYEKAAKVFFEQAIASDRYLLTYKQAGHAIALNPAPLNMRSSLWDIDWFEDPIWRQDRISAINLHFITAFLALHVRGDQNMRSYLDVHVENAEDGTWDAPVGTGWGVYSPGGEDVTLWKGFQRRHARGMSLRRASASK
jgi:predicted dienelactone hydrolase